MMITYAPPRLFDPCPIQQEIDHITSHRLQVLWTSIAGTMLLTLSMLTQVDAVGRIIMIFCIFIIVTSAVHSRKNSRSNLDQLQQDLVVARKLSKYTLRVTLSPSKIEQWAELNYIKIVMSSITEKDNERFYIASFQSEDDRMAFRLKFL